MSHRSPGARSLAALLAATAMLALPAVAAEGAAEYREHTMEAIGGHMQAAADILQQKVPHQDHLSLHVNGLVALSGIVPTLFPDDSEGGDALPAIWENPEDFSSKVQTFRDAAADLKAALDDGGDLGNAFQNVGQACKGCHDDYREE